ncbi:hypothetical protein [Cyanobium sp. Morenito 9A2]|uniref:hypothetical protein n=1 Tax=Cyanobium sp. Morenito 9A2 TaxID=2823718 RepID=UPI0020CDEA48|nr:hypothetical protein [Cyanobium sp. Morenito 9A2]MCP9848651.1 hypothetical protein [Cyanobium sp. Morenito 9A2]
MGESERVGAAFFQSFHAVMLNDLGVVLPALVSGNDLPGFTEAWDDHLAAVAVHTVMEEGVEGVGLGAIAMLDHYLGGVLGLARFAAEHAQESVAQAAVTAAIERGAISLECALGTYQAMVEDHLKHEEAVIVPLVARLPPPGSRNSAIGAWPRAWPMGGSSIL